MDERESEFKAVRLVQFSFAKALLVGLSRDSLQPDLFRAGVECTHSVCFLSNYFPREVSFFLFLKWWCWGDPDSFNPHATGGDADAAGPRRGPDRSDHLPLPGADFFVDTFFPKRGVEVSCRLPILRRLLFHPTISRLFPFYLLCGISPFLLSFPFYLSPISF